MGPVIIFDKSALHCFSVNESVWLENFFLCNITPQFYVETLADLTLLEKQKRPVEEVIKELANKTPINGAQPNTDHHKLVLGNLLGRTVEMEYRPILDGGVPKISPDGKIGFHFEESQEAKALHRWGKGEFNEVEKLFAKEWRSSLSNLNFDAILGVVKNMVPSELRLTSLEDIKKFAIQLLLKNTRQSLFFMLDLLNIKEQFRTKIIQRWDEGKFKSVFDFAPYATYVMLIDLVFYIGMLRGFISKDRPSNKIDIAYLYYLPFCNVFVSGDKLHARVAKLFLTIDQQYVFAEDLKKAFNRLNEYYSLFPDVVKEMGAMCFAPYPPLEIENLVSTIWDNQFKYWCKHAKEKYLEKKSKTNKDDSGLLEHLKRVEKDSIKRQGPPISTDEAEYVIFTRSVAIKKGDWYVLPKNINEKKK